MSVFRESLVFFDQVGLFDVILPFLLVFTLVFAVLEKSNILGTEKSKDHPTAHSRKNINAMVAFVVAFFVVASSQLVELINVFVARVALILVILVMFMLLIAAMHGQQDAEGFSLFKKHKGLAGFLTGLVLFATALIFLDGVGWLEPAWSYATNHWDSQLIGTIFLFAIIVGFIKYVTADKGKEEEKKTGS
jgi:hypothetical protein